MDTGIYTETLARLYLKQGFIAQALAIYRQLVQAQPEHLAWQATIVALEQQLLLNPMAQPPGAPHATAHVPRVAQEATPCCATHVVIAQLERWLATVRQGQG